MDWERGRFRVHAPKTEHHKDGGDRWVPIFPELRPHLEEAFEFAPEGAVHVITSKRHTNQNLRTRFAKIIRRAGLTPWPKPFHNLRASRQTELVQRYPIHVVCAWLGNTAAVAAEHYLQVTEEHFISAAQIPAQSAAETACQPVTGAPGEMTKALAGKGLHLTSIPVRT
jgi:integrase